MKYKKYPKYKDSGVEWIGEIPEGWEVTKLKFVLKNNDGGVWGELDENGTNVIRSTEINSDGSWNFQNPAKCDLNSKDLEKSLLVEGDLIITKSSGSDLHLGKTALVTKTIMEKHCCYSNFMQRIRLNQLNFPKFFFFFINSVGRVNFNYISTTTTGLQNLSQTKINEILFLNIPFLEQKQIAEFLDKQTTQFDELISKSKAQVVLLEEKKQATINQAVTKGLDPSVPMKDSGVEWMGNIPEEWKVKKLKFISDIFGRIGFRGYTVDDIVVEGRGAITLSPSNIINDKFNLKKKVYLSWIKYDESPEIKVFNNDILLVKTGSTIGKVCIVNDETEKMTINPQLIVFKSLKISSKFLYYFMTCNKFKDQIFGSIVGGSTPTTTQETISNHYILLPPPEQQNQILEFLDKQTTQFDELISKSKAQIILLQEKRQALITAAVTGKIDVRSEVVA